MSDLREVVVYSHSLVDEMSPPGEFDPDFVSLRNQAVAANIAAIIGGQVQQAGGDIYAKRYFVPDKPLTREEATNLGITSEDDLFGSVLNHPLHSSKAMLHRLVDGGATRSDGYSEAFANAISKVVLRGFTAFSEADALAGFDHLRQQGYAVRYKDPSQRGENSHVILNDSDELSSLLSDGSALERLAANGVVLEPNLKEPNTLSVGQLYLAGKRYSYYGDQQTTYIDGKAMYGGNTLTMVRGGYNELLGTTHDPDFHIAIKHASVMHEAYETILRPTASRFNVDVLQGYGRPIEPLLGIIDQSLHIGDASPAEMAAILALNKNPNLAQVTSGVKVLWSPTERQGQANGAIVFSHPQRTDVVRILNDAA